MLNKILTSSGQSSGRKMKFSTGFTPNDLQKNYSTIKDILETNLLFSSQILKSHYGIKDETYVYTGANMMINLNTVTEQYVHCDFKDPKRKMTITW